MHNTLRYLLFLLVAIQSAFGLTQSTYGQCSQDVCDEECFRICDVLVTYKCENDFKRVIEYFTGREDRAGRTILRTDDECREGLYFVLWMNCCGFRLPLNSRFELEFIPACVEHPVIRKASWVLDCCGSYTPEVFLGLTGEEWDDYNEQSDFLAWKVSLYSPEGKLVACRESFLWRRSGAMNEPRLERKDTAKAVEVKDVDVAESVQVEKSDANVDAAKN